MGIRNKSSRRKHQFASYLRRHLTFPERIIWSRLKDKRLGVWFYSQRLVYGYIADFWCPRAGLVVEVDGPCHDSRRTYDAYRDAVMRRKGIETMRFPAGAVNNNVAAVVALIADRARRRMA